MFNLLIHYGEDSWESSPVEFDRGRVAVEYTVDSISERYKDLREEAIAELKCFPALFVVEKEESTSRIGYITDIRLHQDSVLVHFEFDPELPELARGTIEAIRDDIDLGKLELTRTHWAIKDDDLFSILIDKGHITKDEYSSSKYAKTIIEQSGNKQPVMGEDFNKSQVFIVHGHDDLAKLDIENFIRELDLEPIILHKQASGGRTIIEKIEEYSNVGFGVVLYTPCDIGTKRDTLDYAYRARQNVVFEHGYLMAKLGRDRVAAIVKGDLETPNDISGVVYINLDEQEEWKKSLVIELRNVGYTVGK